MKKLKQWLIPFSLMLIIPVLNIFYVILNNPTREVNNLVTFIDQNTPLIKIFVIPYLIWYPFIIITMLYLCIKDRSVYFKTLLSYVIGLIVCYMTYLVFQTTVPRPNLLGDDLFTKLLGMVYNADQPFNAFPSIHVLSSFLMMKAISMSIIKNRINQFIIHSNSIIIILSTLFVKQHVILDVISGILVAEVIYRLVDSYYETDRVLLWQKHSNSFLPFKRQVRSNKYYMK